MMTIPASVSIGAQILKTFAVGDSIEARFKAASTPAALDAGCFMTTSEDEQFRAVVGGVMLSYGAGTPEFDRIQREMQNLQKMSAWFSASQAGLSVDMPEIDTTDAIGLMGLWREREK